MVKSMVEDLEEEGILWHVNLECFRCRRKTRRRIFVQDLFDTPFRVGLRHLVFAQTLHSCGYLFHLQSEELICACNGDFLGLAQYSVFIAAPGGFRP